MRIKYKLNDSVKYNDPESNNFLNKLKLINSTF